MAINLQQADERIAVSRLNPLLTILPVGEAMSIALGQPKSSS